MQGLSRPSNSHRTSLLALLVQRKCEIRPSRLSQSMAKACAITQVRGAPSISPHDLPTSRHRKHLQPTRFSHGLFSHGCLDLWHGVRISAECVPLSESNIVPILDFVLSSFHFALWFLSRITILFLYLHYIRSSLRIPSLISSSDSLSSQCSSSASSPYPCIWAG